MILNTTDAFSKMVSLQIYLSIFAITLQCILIINIQ